MVESNPGMTSGAGYGGGFGTGMGDAGGTGTAGTAPMDQMKQTAQQALEQTKQAVGPAVSQMKDQATTQIQSALTTQKDACAESLGGIANAFRTTADNLRDNDQAPIAQYADTVAGWMDNATGYFRERDVTEITRDVEDFARQQPALFIGTAFALGFLAARFLKASGRQVVDYDRPGAAQALYAETENYAGTPSAGTIYAPGAYGSALDEAAPLPVPTDTLNEGTAFGSTATASSYPASSSGASGVSDYGAVGTASGTPITGSSDLEIHTSPAYDDESADDLETVGRT